MKTLIAKPRMLRRLLTLSVLVAAFGCTPQPTLPPGSTPEQRNALRAAHVHEMALRYEARLAQVPQVEAYDVLAPHAGAQARPRVWVDCRTPREQKISMLPGAITRQQLEAEPERFRDAELVVYCTIGYRSTQYAHRLRRQGFDAANLRGGVLAWAHAGGEFNGPEGQPTRAVHTYGRQWDWLPTGHQTAR